MHIFRVVLVFFLDSFVEICGLSCECCWRVLRCGVFVAEEQSRKSTVTCGFDVYYCYRV